MISSATNGPVVWDVRLVPAASHREAADIFVRVSVAPFDANGEPRDAKNPQVAIQAAKDALEKVLRAPWRYSERPASHARKR